MNLYFKNIGMINEASLDINKLTIIAGQNDSGKSTVVKVLYSITHNILDFEKISRFTKRVVIANNLKEIIKTLILNKLWKEEIYGDNYDVLNEESIMGRNTDYDKLLGIKNIIQELWSGNTNIFNELKHSIIHKWKSNDATIFIEEIDRLMNYNQELQKIALSQTFNLEFSHQINNLFIKQPAKVKLTIDETCFLDCDIENNIVSKVSHLKKIHSNDIAYIAWPYIFEDSLFRPKIQYIGLNNRERNLFSKMDKAYSLFKDEDYLQMGLIEDKKKKIEKKINENMGGVLKYSEKNNSLVLKKNGEEILMFNVSMGIESFILLNILLKIDFFKENNILIIDAPEVYLHPKWQIEYAKIITNLAKEFDIKIIVTTHSPYMVKAFKKFSEEEKMTDNTNFYLMKKEGNISNVKNVNFNLEEIYSELGSTFE